MSLTRGFVCFALVCALDVAPALAAAESGAESTEEPAAQQDAAADPTRAPERVLIDLRPSRPGVTLTLLERSAQQERSVAVCPEACRLSLPSGDYHVRVEGRHTRTRVRKLKVRSSESIKVLAPRTEVRSVGIGIGIAGLVLAPTGFLMALAGAFGTWQGDCEEECDYPTGAYGLLHAGRAIFWSGVVMVPLGFTMFGVASFPLLRRTPLATAGRDASGPPAAAQLLPLRDGAVLAISGRF